MTDLTPETSPLGRHKAELPDADNPNLETDLVEREGVVYAFNK